MGRQSTFNEETAAAICDRIANGEPLRAICRDEGMPAWRTVYDWISADLPFATRIAQARQIGFDAIAEEALDIADTPVEGVRREVSTDGAKEVREDMLGHRKLQIDTRLKLLAKWDPKRYGDNSKVELAGSLNLTTMSQDEIDQELADLEALEAARNAALAAVAATKQPDNYDDLV